MARRFASGFATVRDVLTFTAGLLVIGHEVFVADAAEAAAVAVGAALAGLPLVFAGDDRRSSGRHSRER